MKRFLLASLALHALLFAAWPGKGPLQPAATAARPLALQLVRAHEQRAPAEPAASRPVTGRKPVAVPAPPLHAHDSARTMPPQQAQTASRALPATPSRPQVPVQTFRVAGAERLQADSDRARDQVHAAVRSALQANFSYPRRARVRGWEGTVTIALRILPAGEVCNVRITNSSGIDVLDQAALRALREVRIPQAIAWLNGREMDMMIPVEYRLTDG